MTPHAFEASSRQTGPSVLRALRSVSQGSVIVALGLLLACARPTADGGASGANGAGGVSGGEWLVDVREAHAALDREGVTAGEEMGEAGVMGETDEAERALGPDAIDSEAPAAETLDEAAAYELAAEREAEAAGSAAQAAPRRVTPPTVRDGMHQRSEASTAGRAATRPTPRATAATSTSEEIVPNPAFEAASGTASPAEIRALAAARRTDGTGGVDTAIANELRRDLYFRVAAAALERGDLRRARRVATEGLTVPGRDLSTINLLIVRAEARERDGATGDASGDLYEALTIHEELLGELLRAAPASNAGTTP